MTDPYTDAAHDLIGGIPEVLGPWQLSLLMKAGLEPSDVLLDLGCGTLRGGLHLIQYLEDGRYVGVDPNKTLIETGMRLVSQAGLEVNAPRISTFELLDELPEGFADFVITQSVLNHLDSVRIRETVARVDRYLATDGTWVSTGRLSADIEGVVVGQPHPTRPNECLDGVMSVDWFCDVLDTYNMKMNPAPDHPHPRGLDVFTVRRR